MQGIYCLIIDLEKDLNLKIGALGTVFFPKSHYAYIGSAQNNLAKRINRHLSQNKKIHWHIDYLLVHEKVKIINVFYKEAGKQEECKTCNLLASIAEGIKGFGCSDCQCYSHLFSIKPQELSRILKWEKWVY